ncbi:hypothetical protein BH24ACT7_BH24ACT7_25440 [soil metagenome]
MAQLVTRLDDTVVSLIDELVAERVVASRSEAVRLGLEMLIDRHRRRRIADAIVRGYQAQPQTEGDLGWADEATVRMINDEPW